LVIDCPTLSKYKIITNDIVEIVSEQEFKWLGRKDNIINSGGIKIYPEEIEEKLVPFLLGRNYYVTYLPDEQLGNKLILKIKKNSLINEEVDLIFINSKLEKHKTIKEIIYVNDFEYTETEKIIRS
jgi:O-succinylbenzoic acid--CoA ligase